MDPLGLILIAFRDDLNNCVSTKNMTDLNVNVPQ
jgi:hypothetical protein